MAKIKEQKHQGHDEKFLEKKPYAAQEQAQKASLGHEGPEGKHHERVRRDIDQV